MNEHHAAYVIGHITIKDAQKWQDYRSQVPATLAPWGGTLVFRGKRLAVMSGEHKHTDTVVLRFPSTEAASSWFHCAAYQSLIALREQAAEVTLVSFEAE